MRASSEVLVSHAQGVSDLGRGLIVHLLQEHDVGIAQVRIGRELFDGCIDELAVFDVPRDNAELGKCGIRRRSEAGHVTARYRRPSVTTVDAYTRCNQLLDVGRFREARQAALEGLADEPEDAYLHSALARAFRGLNDPLQALSFSEKAVALDPHAAELVAELGYMQLFSGDPDQAVETLRSARSLEPDNSFVIRVSVAVLLGHPKAAKQRGRELLVEARAVADGGVQAHPHHPSMHVASGRVHLAEKQHSGAEVAARHALSIDPTNVSAMTLLADVLAKEGRTHEAGDVYVQAAIADPTSDYALDGLRDVSSGRIVLLAAIIVLLCVVLASIGGPSFIVLPVIMAVVIGAIVFVGDALTKRSEKKTASRKLNPKAQSILDQDRRLR